MTNEKFFKGHARSTFQRRNPGNNEAHSVVNARKSNHMERLV